MLLLAAVLRHVVFQRAHPHTLTALQQMCTQVRTVPDWPLC